MKTIFTITTIKNIFSIGASQPEVAQTASTLSPDQPQSVNWRSRIRAGFAAIGHSGLLLKRGFQPLVVLALIAAITLSSLPTAVSGQSSSAEKKINPQLIQGKYNPQLVLSPNVKWALMNKFDSKGGKEEKGEAGKGATNKKVSPPSGRYRVSIVGFVCNHETRDDIFAWDGLSDEIRLNVETTVVDRDREVLLRGQAESRVMGSVNGEEWRRTRVQAGTADRFGGVRTGDEIPVAPAYAPRFDPRRGTPANPELPFLLFEGDLVQGMNAVVIVPTIWEIDGGAGLWPRFQRAIADALPAIITATATLAGGPSTGAAVGPAAQASISAIDRLMTGIRGGDGGDRVIGIHREGEQESFTPNIIRLNYDIAELALRTRISGPSPVGIVPIVYRDEGDLNGNYTLYVKIERLDPVGIPG